MRVGFWLGALGRRERLSWGDIDLECSGVCVFIQ